MDNQAFHLSLLSSLSEKFKDWVQMPLTTGLSIHKISLSSEETLSSKKQE